MFGAADVAEVLDEVVRVTETHDPNTKSVKCGVWSVECGVCP
jgi:hypothetical protein